MANAAAVPDATGHPYQPDEVRAVVSVACPECELLTPVEHASDLSITCLHCEHAFDIPRDAIHDAQNQCLVALGEA